MAHQICREGTNVYVASDGQEYEMSLQNTCLSCHSNKENFCDSCHSYAEVNPDCWDCHVGVNCNENGQKKFYQNVRVRSFGIGSNQSG